MAENAESLLSLVSVASEGTQLVSATTKYLSTLPGIVIIIEELVAIVSVTGSLLTSLDEALCRYPSTRDQTAGFIKPLCEDVKAAFEELRSKMDEAKEKKVFEANTANMVREQHIAWHSVMGNKENMEMLREKLKVGKFRTRVLIEVVNYKGLNELKKANNLSQEQEAELQELVKMLPLIAERSRGVQNIFEMRMKPLPPRDDSDAATLVPTKAEEETEKGEKDTNLKDQKEIEKKDEGQASSPTIPPLAKIDDSIQEIWLLRRNEPEKAIRSTHHCIGLKYYTSYTYKKESYYVKAVPSSSSEIETLLREHLEELTSYNENPDLKKAILALPDEAQWEIQRLTESRETASSTDKIKREWNVIAFKERPRRKISPEGNQKWWKRGKKPLIEWVIVLRGETADHVKRILPSKHEDPWKARKAEQKHLSSGPPNLQAGNVLRPVVTKPVMTQEEAEQKMDGILRDLFQSERKTEQASETQDLVVL